MLKENLTELYIADKIVEEVDLDYTFLVDDKMTSVYIKFDGFSDEIQMGQFATFMEQHLPLIFTKLTKH